MIDAEIGWGLGGFDGELYPRVLRTLDGGHTWSDVTPPEPGLVQLAETDTFSNARPFFMDRQRAWVIYRDLGRVWRTSDGGATWHASQPLPLEGMEAGDSFHDEYLSPMALQFIDPRNGWLAVNEAQAMMHGDIELLRTHDGGVTWQHIYHGTIYSFSGMVFLDTRIGWLADGEKSFTAETLEASRDGGLSWEAVTSLPGTAPDTHYLACQALCQTGFLHTFPPKVGMFVTFEYPYACGVEGMNVLYVTTDAGKTWEARPLPINSTSHRTWLVFTDPLFGWLLDSLKGKLFATADGGRTWTELPEVAWGGRLDFISADQGWAIAWPIEGGEPWYQNLEGRVLLRTIDGGLTWEQLQPRLIP
jgi:photosystem II stability/assembly factor-like uncharacterized protein